MSNQLINLLTNIYSPATWLFYSLTLAWLIQMAYYLGIFIKITKKIPVKPYVAPVPVSVIICAKNEADNLRERLASILEQNYPDFEVIVVDDASTDETTMVLDEFKNKYKNLYVTEIAHDKRFVHGKKLALTIGIKAAKHEWLLLTDADCKPTSQWWIKTMSQNFTEKNDIVLGFGGYEQLPGFFNRLVRYDGVFIAIQYFTYAMCGMPYMGVGRNLAYRKSLFFESKGFAGHSRLMSGDDDLFVNQNANSQNTAWELNKNSFTTCPAQPTFAKWNAQKQRHFTTSDRYKTKHKIFLAVENASRCWFYLSTIAICFFECGYIAAAILFLTRFSIFLYTINKAAEKFNTKGITAAAILFDFILPYISLVQLLLGKIRKDRLTWK